MFQNYINKKLSASLLALLFLLFPLSTGIAMTGSAHASMMPDLRNEQDYSAHLRVSVEESAEDYDYQSQSSVAPHNLSSTCAALCQTNTTTNPTASLPVSEKEKDDEIYDEHDSHQTICFLATDDAEPVYEDRKLKVPLYLKNCLLRL